MGRKYKIVGVVVASTGGGSGNLGGDWINRFKNWWDKKVDKPIQDRLKDKPWWVQNLAKLVSLAGRSIGAAFVGIFGAIITVAFGGKGWGTGKNPAGQGSADDDDTRVVGSYGEETDEEKPSEDTADEESEDESAKDDSTDQDSPPNSNSTSASDDSDDGKLDSETNQTPTTTGQQYQYQPPASEPTQEPIFPPIRSSAETPEFEPAPWELLPVEPSQVEPSDSKGPVLYSESEDTINANDTREIRIRTWDDGSNYVEGVNLKDGRRFATYTSSNGIPEDVQIQNLSKTDSEFQSTKAREEGFDRRANETRRQSGYSDSDGENQDPKRDSSKSEIKNPSEYNAAGDSQRKSPNENGTTSGSTIAMVIYSDTVNDDPKEEPTQPDSDPKQPGMNGSDPKRDPPNRNTPFEQNGGYRPPSSDPKVFQPRPEIGNPNEGALEPCRIPSTQRPVNDPVIMAQIGNDTYVGPQSEYLRRVQTARDRQTYETIGNVVGGIAGATAYTVTSQFTDDPDALYAASALGASVDQMMAAAAIDRAYRMGPGSPKKQIEQSKASGTYPPYSAGPAIFTAAEAEMLGRVMSNPDAGKVIIRELRNYPGWEKMTTRESLPGGGQVHWIRNTQNAEEVKDFKIKYND